MPTFVPGRRTPHPADTHPRLFARTVLRSGYSGTVPDECDYHSGITFPGYLNDRIGDCTIADSGHAEQVFSHFGQGTTVTVTDQDVLTVYERVSGYDPSDPDTDQGCIIQDVLSDWRRNGLAGHKILAFLQVDHTSKDETAACCWLFGGVRLGVYLPQSALDAFDTGSRWDYDPMADNTILGGHDVRIVGYDTPSATFTVVTWGALVTVTWEWVQAFTEEAWAECDGEWIKSGKAPEGLDVATLNAAFAELTGERGPFPDTPDPGPVGPGPMVDPADQTLATTVRPELRHLSHHGAGRTVHNALRGWLAAKGL